MATAAKQARPTRQRARPAGDGVSIEFVVFQSNSGEYRWEIVAGGGATLAQSDSFASFDDAEKAAIGVRDAAGSARLDSHSPGDGAPARGPAAAAIGTGLR